MRKVLFLLILSIILFSTEFVSGQGVTTASLKGSIVNITGNSVEGVSIGLVHVPSGSQYGTMTFSEGTYNLQGLRVGGPYKIVISSIGYETQEKADVYLNLNQTTVVNFTIVQKDQKLEEITISYDKNADRTGAETFVNSKEISKMPSISRGQSDLTRLTPLADGNSFGGRNKLYNNFSLDGSIFNNSFGLDYATPGGQADAQPVSLDAIEQIQVSIAPFDVREGGFTGAGINAVTKSGTNELKFGAYYYFRNENMIGENVADVEVPNYDFNTSLSGITIGGPIKKDKLFFFISAEAERRDQVAHGFIANDGNSTGSNVTSVSETDIQAVQQHLINEWNYNPGAYQGYNHETYNNKFLIKLDWNINKKHNASIRYNMLDAWRDILPHPEAIIGRGPTNFRLPFEKSSYVINNEINSVVTELNSRFSNKFSNKLMISYTAFRDFREPHSQPFPVIDIFDENGNLAITAGSEMFSTNNILDQDVFQFTDNLTYYGNKHTITVGLNYEMFKFNNSFNLFYYPWYMYFSLESFLNTTANDVDFNSDVTESQKKDFAMAEVDVAQLGVYIQDEFSPIKNLDITVGIRVDVPLYLNSVAENPDIKNYNGWVDTEGNSINIDPSVWPDANLMWSPRFGFNWNILGDNSLKIRGGSGIFTGRIPFVWLGNQSTNSGMVEESGGYYFQVNTTESGFKFPQVWKNNLAFDYKFGNGWFASLEGIYGSDINAVVHRNYDMLKPTQQLSGADNRAVFGGFNETHIYAADSNTETFLDAGTIVMENVAEGHQYSFTALLKKDFNFGMTTNVSYSYLESKDHTSIPAEIAADAFQRNAIVGDPNQSMFSYSRYGLKHRIIASLIYAKAYKNMLSSFAMFFEIGKGGRYSYTYAGDLNQDGISNNDLLYVPANSSEINFGTIDAETGEGIVAENSDNQWTMLEKFIEQDEYLSERKGDYVERNGVMLPWFSQLDIRFAQDFNFNVKGKKNTIQLSFDLINVGNLINSEWGVRQLANTYTPIAVNGLDNNNVPYYNFNTELNKSYINDVSNASKWQLQIGIRYIFN